MKKKTLFLILSLTLNILLLGGVFYIGAIKTTFFKRVWIKIGLLEKEEPALPSDYWCIAGWNNSFRKIGIDFDVVFFGDSITADSDFREYFPSVSICNLGYPGDNLDGMMLRIPSIQAVHPHKVFVMAGINGLNSQTELTFTEKYDRLVSALCDSLPNTQIFLQSILPVNNNDFERYVCDNKKIGWANTVIDQIAKDHNCVYIDLFNEYAINDEMPKNLSRDGLHLFSNAYDRWALAIDDYIQ